MVEKGGEVGAHILSGAVIEPRALDELLPDWRERGAPLATPARDDRFLFLTATRAVRLPTPPQMHNHGNYIASLGDLCRWLGRQAEALGVEIYPGLRRRRGAGGGRPRRRRGHRRHGHRQGRRSPTANYQPGMELRARYTHLRRGLPGPSHQAADAAFRPARGRDPQTYGIGVKELWEVPAEKHKPGLVVHTIGWPLDCRHLWRVVPLPFWR